MLKISKCKGCSWSSGDTALKTHMVLSWKSLLGSNNQRLPAQLTASCQDVAKCEHDSDASLGQSSFKTDKVENICGQINQNWKFVLGNMDATSCRQSAVLEKRILLSRWRLSGEALNISANNDKLIKQHGFTSESRYCTDLVMGWMSCVTDVKAELTHFLHLKCSTLHLLSQVSWAATQRFDGTSKFAVVVTQWQIFTVIITKSNKVFFGNNRQQIWDNSY